MAGASMKDIKSRIKSVQSTMQITKAMELVASSKLRRAKERQERLRPYHEELRRALNEIESSTNDFSSVYQQKREIHKTCMIVIAGDRGLAGGYNSNVFKLATSLTEGGEPFCVLPIGKRALEFFRRRGHEILTDEFQEAAVISVSDCFLMSRLITEGFASGQFDRVTLVYTKLHSLLSQTPDTMELLPLTATKREEKAEVRELILYEPSPDAVYNAIVPSYIAGMLFSAMCESVASELAARRTAMDAASKNAAEMIEDLSLRYNRARQGAITQEITEIVAGAEH